MIYLITVFLSFLITVVLTPYLIEQLIKKDIVDKPNGEERRVHTVPIPRLGGIVIFTVIFTVTFAVYPDFFSKPFFLLGALVIFLLGLYDDIKPLNWVVKFGSQSIGALLLIISLNYHNFTQFSFFGFILYPGLDYVFLFVLILGLLNSFNLLDGLDGLVSGLSAVIASMCFLLSIGKPFVFLPFLASAVVGTTLGFVKFNANPARIFLGDSGSLTLGYIVTGLVLVVSSSVSESQIISSGLSNTVDLTFVIIVFAVPIADTLRVMLVRLKNGKHLFMADSNHIHHILYSQRIRHKTVVMLIHLFAITFVLLAVYYAKISKPVAVIIFFILITAFLFTKQIVEFIIRTENLLVYGRLYKKIPKFSPTIYNRIILPIISIVLVVVIITLLLTKSSPFEHLYQIFLILLVGALFYSAVTLRRSDYYAELLVLFNLVLFFILTGFNNFFYTQYPVPLIQQINLNQVLIILLSSAIILFVLLKERFVKITQQYLTGSDLTLAVLILFIYVAVQFINIPESYRISDIMLRSYLVFLFYKILVLTKPGFHFHLYYSSFLISAIAVLKSIF